MLCSRVEHRGVGETVVHYRHGAGLPSVQVVECAEGALSDLLAVGAHAGLQTHKLSLPAFSV